MKRMLPILFLLGAGACDQDLAGDAPTVDSAGATAGEIEYVARWSQKGVTPLDTGWAITNDRGYRIEVHRGYMVTYGASLVPCTSTSDESVGAWIRAIVGIGVAHAGHDSDADPSAISTSRVESVDSPASWTIGQVVVPGTRYCGAHYLVARADEDTLDMPNTVDLDRKSLYLAGVYTAPGAEAAQPFEISTSLANGVIRPLETDEIGIDLNETQVQVVIERPLAGLFDGVEFETMSSATVERQVLTALMANTSITTYVSP